MADRYTCSLCGSKYYKEEMAVIEIPLLKVKKRICDSYYCNCRKELMGSLPVTVQIISSSADARILDDLKLDLLSGKEVSDA